MSEPQYFDQGTYWSVKWYNLMIVNIIILLFYALILPVPYTAYICTFCFMSWMFYLLKYLELREQKKKEKKDGLESTSK